MEEKGLIIKKENIFSKFICFFKNLFSKKQVEVQPVSNIIIPDEVKKDENRFQDNLSKVSKLLDIQKRLCAEGINEDNLRNLVKDLSYQEKVELRNLYINQNESLKVEIQNYKFKIEALRKEI